MKNKILLYALVLLISLLLIVPVIAQEPDTESFGTTIAIKELKQSSKENEFQLYLGDHAYNFNLPADVNSSAWESIMIRLEDITFEIVSAESDGGNAWDSGIPEHAAIEIKFINPENSDEILFDGNHSVISTLEDTVKLTIKEFSFENKGGSFSLQVENLTDEDDLVFMSQPMLWIDNVQPKSGGGSVKVSEAAALSEEKISLAEPKLIYTASFRYSDFPFDKIESIREMKIRFEKITGEIVTKDADTNGASYPLDMPQALELVIIP